MGVKMNIRLTDICGSGLYVPLDYYAQPRARGRMLFSIDGKLRQFAEYADLPCTRRQQIAVGIETGCYDHTVADCKERDVPVDWDNKVFNQRYDDVCYALLYKFQNTNQSAAIDCVKNIIAGACDVKKLASMPAEEYRPELYQRALERYDLVSNVSETTKIQKLYRCRRCGHNECIVRANPYRSGDEQIPQRVICTFCGDRWAA